MDRLVKHEYKVKGYLRYCDDFCLFHDDKKFLHEMAETIRTFLADRLKLTYSKCDVFLGYRHFRNYILLRKSTAKRVKRRLTQLPKQLALGEISKEQFRSSIASTRGWLRWANTHHLSLQLQIDNLQELGRAT